MNLDRSRSFSPRGALAFLLVLLILLPANWGCTVFRDPVPPGFDTLSIQVEVERDRKGRVKGNLAAYSTLKGVLVGAAAGGPLLAIAAGSIAIPASIGLCLVTIGTGPFAILAYPACVISVSLVAIVGGFAVGLVGGITIGAIGGLPSETAKQVTAVLADFEGSFRFEDEMLAVMQSAIPQEKQASAGNADAVLTARLDRFRLRQHSKNHLSIRLQAEMEQAWKDERGKDRDNTCKYRFDSERKPADDWLADNGAAFRDAVALGMETIGRWMNRDLEAFASETELDKTDDDPKSCFRRKRWYDIFLLF